ncbi:hypothetical protein [Flindersiella endophytica]
MATLSVAAAVVAGGGCHDGGQGFGSTTGAEGTTTLTTESPVPWPTAAPPNYGQTLADLPYGTFRLHGALPEDGGPATARTYDLERPTQRRVLDLAAALGFGDAEVEFGQSPWTVVKGEAVLRVWPETGGLWEYQRASTYGPSGESPPDRAHALATSRPLLRAVGLDKQRATVDTRNSTTAVEVAPAIDGLATWGYETTLQLDSDGVVGGRGWLGVPSGQAARTVDDAARTFQRLRALADHPPSVDGCPSRASRSYVRMRTPPCPNLDASFDVVGARFVLAVDDVPRGTAVHLVPAWLFELQSSTTPRYVAFRAAPE